MVKALLATAMLVAFPAQAAEWTAYENPRFGYTSEIPPDYRLSFESENGDGRIYHSPDGDLLAFWGAEIEGGDFADVLADKMAEDAAAGWDISYRRVTPGWASYSGILGDQIRYVRAIDTCGGRAVYFLMDYRRSAKEEYDPIVTRMVRRLRSAC